MGQGGRAAGEAYFCYVASEFLELFVRVGVARARARRVHGFCL
jgi:ATP-dependent Zn protease